MLTQILKHNTNFLNVKPIKFSQGITNKKKRKEFKVRQTGVTSIFVQNASSLPKSFFRIPISTQVLNFLPGDWHQTSSRKTQRSRGYQIFLKLRLIVYGSR